MKRSVPAPNRPLLEGLRAWTLQRATAIYLLGFGIALALRIATTPPDTYPAWLALWRGPFMTAASLLAFASLCLHAWVGARDVILDYVRPVAARPLALALAALLLLVAFASFAQALLAIPA